MSEIDPMNCLHDWYSRDGAKTKEKDKNDLTRLKVKCKKCDVGLMEYQRMFHEKIGTPAWVLENRKPFIDAQVGGRDQGGI